MKSSKPFSFANVQGHSFGSIPIGKPQVYSHVFFVDGLLIDTGHSNMRQEVVEVISQWPVEQIFITHHHEDHTGNLGPVQARFSVPTWTSASCIELMKSPPKISFAQKLTWGKSEPNFKMQVEEKTIKTPKHTFELYHIPGHAVDMQCLYEREQGWLFSADLWVNEYIRYFMREESVAEQIESIKKVLKLDFEQLFCSHNPQFKDGKAKMVKKLQFMEDFYGKVAMLYHKGNSPKAIMKKMGLKEKWMIRIVSTGALSTINMVRSVIRDEQKADR